VEDKRSTAAASANAVAIAQPTGDEEEEQSKKETSSDVASLLLTGGRRGAKDELVASSFRILDGSWSVPCEPASSITRGGVPVQLCSLYMRRLVLVIDWGKGKGTSSGARAGWLVSRVGTGQGRAALSLFAAPATSIPSIRRNSESSSSLLLPQWILTLLTGSGFFFFLLMLLLLQYLLTL